MTINAVRSGTEWQMSTIRIVHFPSCLISTFSQNHWQPKEEYYCPKINVYGH